jgi:hypothetical protein
VRTVLAAERTMAGALIFLLIGLFIVFAVSGVYTPAGMVIAAALIVGYVVVWRAKRKRGSAAKL